MLTPVSFATEAHVLSNVDRILFIVSMVLLFVPLNSSVVEEYSFALFAILPETPELKLPNSFPKLDFPNSVLTRLRIVPAAVGTLVEPPWNESFMESIRSSVLIFTLFHAEEKVFTTEFARTLEDFITAPSSTLPSTTSFAAEEPRILPTFSVSHLSGFLPIVIRFSVSFAGITPSPFSR